MVIDKDVLDIIITCYFSIGFLFGVLYLYVVKNVYGKIEFIDIASSILFALLYLVIVPALVYVNLKENGK